MIDDNDCVNANLMKNFENESLKKSLTFHTDHFSHWHGVGNLPFFTVVRLANVNIIFCIMIVSVLILFAYTGN